MQALKPTVFEDLIAMNALYRPGPMEYIPSFIARKHGDEEIAYDLPDMKEYLEETYGITVYQEQVMLLSQSLAGFTKGEADVLRKAMGKKILSVLDKMKPQFLKGGEKTGIHGKFWRKYGKTGKLLPLMPLTNRTPLAMRGSPTKPRIAKPTTQLNIWLRYSVTT